jgi:hypothetical protein
MSVAGRVVPVDLNAKENCTPAQKAVCGSIGGVPLGWLARKKLLRSLRGVGQHECGDIPGALSNLLQLSMLYADRHRAIGSAWGRLHYVLGVPAAILATVAGATAWNSTSQSNVAAVLALAAGALSAAAAFFKCEQSRDRNNALCGGWTELADCVRMALLHYAMDEKSPLGVDHARYAESMISLNRIKSSLLSGALRAGPEKSDKLLAGSAAPSSPVEPNSSQMLAGAYGRSESRSS